MSEDAIGAAFAVVVGLLVGMLHLWAARDPERNAITRLIRDHYDHRWPVVGSGLPNEQAMLIVGIVSLLCALAATAGLIYALTR